MKKFLFLGACVASLAVASSSALAAVDYGQESTLSVEVNEALTELTVKTDLKGDGQKTLLMTGSDDFIYYIDQAAAGTGIFSDLELRLQEDTDKLQPGTYTVKVGNDQSTALLTATVTITEDSTALKKTVKYGDVNGDSAINGVDASLVLQRYVGSLSNFVDSDNAVIPDKVGDVNGDDSVNGVDASLILQNYVGSLSNFVDSENNILTDFEY